MCLDDRSEFTQSNAQWQSTFSQNPNLYHHALVMRILKMGTSTEISKEGEPNSVVFQPHGAFITGGGSICVVATSI